MFAPAIAFVDLETTGATPTGDRVTEIGIVRVVDGEVAEEWSSLVNPECSIPEEIQALTGITNEMVRGKPTFAELRHEVMDRVEDHLFVAHNARFDYGFLKNEFRRVEMPFTADVLCTVRLSRRLYPEAVGHSLDALIARHALMDEEGPPVLAADGLSLARTGRHSALGDARALWRFVQAAYRDHSGEAIEKAVRRILKIPSLPPQLPPDALEGLPEGPGVYRFYGVGDIPIYIGKSVNLRERVRSHFSSDYRTANDVRLSSEIRRIEVEETAGELGALLREARLVKELLPLHNHRLRRKLGACFLRLPDLRSPPEVVMVKDLDLAAGPTPGETLFGPFATKAHAKALLENLAGENGLCWRLLGWEKRGGPCFARQVRKCRGACLGEETPEQHHLRLATALVPHRFRDWPWPGRMAIRERHPEGRLERLHLFEHWCYLGSAEDDASFEDLLESRHDAQFDPDIYRIVAAFIDRHPGAARAIPPRSRISGSEPLFASGK